jgi:hypothetical protein
MCLALLLSLSLALALVTLQFGASLTDNTSIVSYNRIVFMIQAIGVFVLGKFKWLVDIKRSDQLPKSQPFWLFCIQGTVL